VRSVYKKPKDAGNAEDKLIVTDTQQFHSLLATIATARTYRSLALGNIPETIKYAEQALKLRPKDDRVRYIQATSLLGIAQYTSGDLEAAECSLSDFQTKLREIGEITTLISITFLLGDIRVALGRLNDAKSSYTQSIHLAEGQGEPLPVGTSDLYRGFAELCIEQNDLEAATQYLLTGRKLGEQSATSNWFYRLQVSRARLKEAQGNLDEALDLLDEAEHAYIRSPLPDVHPVAAFKARIWLKQGKLTEAMRWAREQALKVDDDILFTREFEYITLARVLIAAGENGKNTGFLGEAVRLLERLLKAAETGARLGSAIQILLLQALAFQSQDNLVDASLSLKRALGLAEKEDYIRVFLDEGEVMRLLIEKQTRDLSDSLRDFSDKLLAAFPQPVAVLNSERVQQKPDIIEPLSERELEVLRLLRGELSGPEIARYLIVSLNTLRTHTKSIYTKLGVNNRRAAVRRAEQLNII
jgi:LuxR family maltose regulon positive regulatory protein